MWEILWCLFRWLDISSESNRIILKHNPHLWYTFRMMLFLGSPKDFLYSLIEILWIFLVWCLSEVIKKGFWQILQLVLHASFKLLLILMSAWFSFCIPDGVKLFFSSFLSDFTIFAGLLEMSFSPFLFSALCESFSLCWMFWLISGASFPNKYDHVVSLRCLWLLTETDW